VTIFVDTSYWIALRNRSDAHHQEAAALHRARSGDRLLTSNHVRGETWTYLLRRAGHRSATDFLDAIDGAARLSVSFISRELEAEAVGWLRRHDEREYSFVDATSFALMREKGIQEALAFDGDFSAAGLVELRP
jgi:predicted nucleic acid-binding protein